MEFPSALDPLRSFKAVWSAVRASPGALVGWWALGLVGGFGLYLAFYVVAFVFLAASGAAQEAPSELAVPALGGLFLVLALGFGLAMFVAQCWWRVGLENVLADTLRTGTSQLSDAWKPRGRVVAVMVAHLLAGLGLFVCYLPLGMGLALSGLLGELAENHTVSWLLGLPLFLLWLAGFAYVGLGLLFAPFAAALDPVGPLEAVARSWRVARGRRLALLLFWIATLLFALAGVLLLCVGYLASVSLVYLMPAEAWLALTRGEERAGWWITTGKAPEPADTWGPAA